MWDLLYTLRDLKGLGSEQAQEMLLIYTTGKYCAFCLRADYSEVTRYLPIVGRFLPNFGIFDSFLMFLGSGSGLKILLGPVR